jgi:alpha-1,6-mannosyltransferase
VTPRILLLTNYVHPASGGIRTFVSALTAEAVRAGRPFAVVIPGEHDAVDHVAPHVDIHTLQANPAPAFDRRYRLLMPRHYWPPHQAPLARILADWQPDVIEVCDKYTLLYLGYALRLGGYRLPRRPLTVALSSERMDDNIASYVTPGVVGQQFSRWYMRRLYRPAFDRHLANSTYTADEVVTAYGPGAHPIVPLARMGVDSQAFRPDARDTTLRAQLLAGCGGTSDSVLLGYVGRLSPEKHLDALIGMLEDLSATGRRDYRLVVIGDGPARESFMYEARLRVPGRVHHVPSITDRESLATHYASLDVFVHPNPKEPFGIGPLEAMASGVPVVVPRAGGVLSYATDDNAWLAEPRGAGLADAVTAAVESPAPQRLHRAAETAAQHHWPVVAQEHFQQLEHLLCEHRAAQATAAVRRRVVANTWPWLSPVE